MKQAEALFELGRIVATPAALELAEEDGLDLASFVVRHVTGDFGDVDAGDAAANRRALQDGSRILSVYGAGSRRLWIITEAQTDACPACHGYGGTCEPTLGEWHADFHFRTDRPARRLATAILLPSDY